MKTKKEELFSLLTELISIPSFSGQEGGAADCIQHFLERNSIVIQRKKNNIIARNKFFDPGKKNLLLNTHHDTVKPVDSWKRNPFHGVIENNRVYGLGSNDAGGSLIAMVDVFLKFYDRKDLKMNILLVLSAEEEISGTNGISDVLPEIPVIDFGIVGEPSALEMAIAEKGLMVLDCKSHGIAGHAARTEGNNAIYNAINDIEWFKNFKFPKNSELLGPVKMSVTIIHAGTQHNMIPDECNFTVDVRSTEVYSHQELLELIKSNVQCDVIPRSVRLNPSGISRDHPLVLAGIKSGLRLVGSPALSDQALMTFPTVKIGPGDPNRSHTADEYIEVEEIIKGMNLYEELISFIVL